MSAALARMRMSLALLTERRAALFACIDAFFLLAGVNATFLGGSGSGRDFWIPSFLLPILVLGVPLMADAVAVERRSGTLDLALTSPGVRFYFERRVAAVAVLMIAQGWLVLLLATALTHDFPLSGPLVQVVFVVAFLTAATLNWTLRLKSAVGVVFATYGTCLVFLPWLFSNPIHPPTEMPEGRMVLGDYIDFAQQNLVLAVAAAVFYLYAQQRLARPESIIQ
ncbi:MAG TPA: hypothetical protein VF432_18380 [Thermoanaerobaculia bacterium]